MVFSCNGFNSLARLDRFNSLDGFYGFNGLAHFDGFDRPYACNG